MSEIEEIIIRSYRCHICKEVHEIKLGRTLVDNHKRFPFPHVFLHGDLKEYLTILYLDEELQIRGSEVQNLAHINDNLFSMDHTISIVSNLMDEIERLRDESVGAFPKDQLKTIISNLMNEIESLRRENENLIKKLEDLKNL